MQTQVWLITKKLSSVSSFVDEKTFVKKPFFRIFFDIIYYLSISFLCPAQMHISVILIAQSKIIVKKVAYDLT